MRMHWSMRGGGDQGFVKGRQEQMAGDALTFKDAGYFDYTGPVDFAEDRALKEEKRNKELMTALAGIALLVYFF
jgi:hypothetical protein